MCCRNRCAICTTLIKPSMFKSGKHHCRRCGQLVCGKCSTKRKVVPGKGEAMVRVCDPCFDFDDR